MKTVIVCVLALVGLALAGTDLHPRGCIYINGKCDRDCEVGTRAYTTGCGYLTPEATCEEPHPVTDQRGHVCDYSACYCEPGMVRHTPTKTCVKLEDCEKLGKEPEKLDKQPEILDKLVK
ncbi:uncharacterized protein LOC121735917 [Aricia agestis]|uniref:uncharacterized protein LOC121735917 n=1 Tax=Aricia agestis TaxID=91739 RepID=UPI001C208AF8|nr:uncharacterized protein LOC121735917 [Aricia agestis]